MNLNLGDMMAKVQELQARMAETQESLRGLTKTVDVGGGMVQVTINGKQEVLSLAIEPGILASGDKAMLEDLIISAVNKAIQESQKMAQEKLGEVTSGMMPGLDLSRFGL
jgi:nucleoid-associated protein EbfC